MMKPLPMNAPEISVEWRKDDYGIGISAFTDEAGLPYIGLYPLDNEGYPAGLPGYVQRRQLMVDAVAGDLWEKPAVLFLDIEVNENGLDVRLAIPPAIAAPGYTRHLWAHWRKPSRSI